MKYLIFIMTFCVGLNIDAQRVKRDKGEPFVFSVQGDSHPERNGKMFSADLYRVNMRNASSFNPDFYFLMGDDCNIDRLIGKNEVTQKSVDRIYEYQKSFTDIIGCQVYPVVGNHELIAKYMLNDKSDNPAVYSARAMMKYFPVPEAFSGNEEYVNHVGVLKDYYAFEHGDALFVVIDPYWHSDSPVDNIPGDKGKTEGRGKQTDRNKNNRDTKKTPNPTKNSWAGTLGKTQYEWLKNTLAESKCKYKFVFAHHVNGSGRGGIECATLFEWGGYGRNGKWEFDKMRSGWEMPIHQLFVKYGVTIFFQGHDHLFCRQQLDGVVYQSCPNPADNTYRAFNSDAYKSGDVVENSGFIKVSVSSDEVLVEYIRAFLPGDGNNSEVAYSYTITK